MVERRRPCVRTARNQSRCWAMSSPDADARCFSFRKLPHHHYRTVRYPRIMPLCPQPNLHEYWGETKVSFRTRTSDERHEIDAGSLKVVRSRLTPWNKFTLTGRLRDVKLEIVSFFRPPTLTRRAPEGLLRFHGARQPSRARTHPRLVEPSPDKFARERMLSCSIALWARGF